MSDTGYLNFDLEIERAETGYRAQVLSSPAGEASVAVQPEALQRLDLTAPSEVLGGQLFDAVFQGEVLSCLRRSLDEAERTNQGLRLRLRLPETPELAGLPWETLYDRTRGRFLALSRETPLVRYIDLPEPARSLEPGPRLRVLVVIASPSGLPPLDTAREWANLQEALDDLQRRGTVEIRRLEPASVAALQRELLQQEYHILHFVGHGDLDPQAREGVVLLADADGRPQPISGQYLSTLLRDHRSLRLALLNACRGAIALPEDPYAGVAQKLVRGGIPAVIAMRTAISDEAGIVLARSFYTALAAGAGVDAALAEARKALYTGGHSDEWCTPALYMRAPDGNLWPRPAVGQPRRFPDRRLALVAVSAAMLLIALIAAAYFLLVPGQMDTRSTMNVAVAEVGRLDERGQMAVAKDGVLIRDWIVGGLTAANLKTPAASRIGLWHDGLSPLQKRVTLGVVAGATADERAAAAASLAGRIAADLVIYGHVAGSGADTRFVQEFYVSPRLRPESEETIGRYQLGDPIPLPADLGRADTLAREAVASDVAVRADALFRLVLGLREDLLGHPEAALALFRQAESDLTTWAERGEGKEILYYFIAREALSLRRYDEALAAANRAIASNPSYPRGHSVRGSVLVGQAQTRPPAERLAPGGLLAQAEDSQRRAIELAVQARDTRMEIITRLALASVHIVQGIACYDLDTEAGDMEALQRLELAASEVRPLLAPLEEIKQYRLLAQAYSYIGAAHLEQGSVAHRRGDRSAAIRYFSQARDALQGCIDQGRRAPEDKTLNQKIIGELCRQYQDIALSALRDLGGPP